MGNKGWGDFGKHLLKERGRNLDSRNTMSKRIEVGIYLKHLQSYVNNKLWEISSGSSWDC